MANSFVSSRENTARVNLVRAWIKERGISRVFLCRQTGIKYPSYLSAMIGKNAIRSLPPHTFNKIANFFKN